MTSNWRTEREADIKATGTFLPLHEAQLLTYLKLTVISVGLLIHFNTPMLVQGPRRPVNNEQPTSASQRLCG